MGIRVGVGIAAIFSIVSLTSGNAHTATIHLQIDPQKSEIRATVADPLARLRESGEIEARLRITSGEIDGDPQNPGQTGHIKFVIDATTFDSGNNHRDNVVLGTALDTAQYQTISFESTHIENVQIDVPGKMGHAIVVGNLTLHGTTREIRVPADISLNSDGTLSGDGEVSFNYTDFGVRVPRLLFALPAGSDVTVHFHVTAEPSNAARLDQVAPPGGVLAIDERPSRRPHHNRASIAIIGGPHETE
jgi:polyisoprenoid-binding protein YceI